MSSKIIAGTTSGTALNMSADTSGVLEIQTGSTPTTAITVDASQNVTFAKPIVLGTASLGAGDSSMLKNRIINGAMVINQRGVSVTANTSTSGTYITDRFREVVTSGTGVFTVAQDTSAPAGFVNSLKATVTTAYTVTGTDRYEISQLVEGYNIADLGWGTANAKTVTLSFWVQSSLTGTFGGVIQNANADYNYPFTYTISSANTWTQVSVTAIGPTSGTWATDNTQGLKVTWSLGCGSTRLGTAGAWSSTRYEGATGQTQVIATNGATFYITGVQLEVGSSATGFEYRMYGTELANCQRYYAKMNSTVSNGACGAGVARASTASNVFIKLPVTMRTIPTVSYSSAYLNYNSDVYQLVNGNSGVQGGTDSINYFPNSSTAGMTTGYPVLLAIGSGGYVDFSSEL